jgi:hypothetical protein
VGALERALAASGHKVYFGAGLTTAQAALAAGPSGH